MKKVIREVDEKRGVIQITVADERWYTRPTRDESSGIPVYKPVPSVTWIAGYYPKGIEFYKWLAEKGWDESQAIKVAAGDKGSAVHYAIEMILNGLELRIDTEIPDRTKDSEFEAFTRQLTYEELLCIQSFLDWKKEIETDYTIETISTERNIFSDKHGFAGTIDWIVFLTPKVEGSDPLKLGKRSPFVIDFKTSQYIWTEYELQLSAYGEAITNGENPIAVRNENGTETNELIDFTGLRLAILQVGYKKNKNMYKFNVLENFFGLFKVAQQIWHNENVSKKTGELKTTGFTVMEFPLVLSPATKNPEDEVIIAIDPGHPDGDQTVETVIEIPVDVPAAVAEPSPEPGKKGKK